MDSLSGITKRVLMIGAASIPVCFLIIYLLHISGLVIIAREFPVLKGYLVFSKEIARGMGSSVLFFAINVLWFLLVLRKLRCEVRSSTRNIPEIQFLDNYCNMLVNLSFAIGIFYTAFGMVRALYITLSGLTQEVAESLGAWEILRSLVDGGIIMALVTTMAGLVLGYGMRIIKYRSVGREILRIASAEAREQINDFKRILADIQETLLRIERGGGT